MHSVGNTKVLCLQSVVGKCGAVHLTILSFLPFPLLSSCSLPFLPSLPSLPSPFLPCLQVLHETALVEAFNLKAAIEYQLKNC